MSNGKGSALRRSANAKLGAQFPDPVLGKGKVGPLFVFSLKMHGATAAELMTTKQQLERQIELLRRTGGPHAGERLAELQDKLAIVEKELASRFVKGGKGGLDLKPVELTPAQQASLEKTADKVGVGLMSDEELKADYARSHPGRRPGDPAGRDPRPLTDHDRAVLAEMRERGLLPRLPGQD